MPAWIGAAFRPRTNRTSAAVPTPTRTEPATPTATQRSPRAPSKSSQRPNTRNSTLARLCRKPSRQPLVQKGARGDGDAVGQHHAHGGADPDARPVVVAGECDGGQHRLVAEFGEDEGGHDREDHEAWLGDLDVVVIAVAALPPCPDREQQERDGAREGDRSFGKRQAEEVADGDRESVHQGGGDARRRTARPTIDAAVRTSW